MIIPSMKLPIPMLHRSNWGAQQNSIINLLEMLRLVLNQSWLGVGIPARLIGRLNKLVGYSTAFM
jgi:hypothetical protein